MDASAQSFSPAEAARRLGVSTKALRIYEEHGLIAPPRTASGWRTYGPAEINRATEIATLRALGLSLAQVGQVLKGDAQSLPRALALHQEALHGQLREVTDKIEKVRRMCADLARGQAPSLADLERLMRPADKAAIAFDLPWPWGGERFELHDIRRLNFIVGPLFSGKTRLARAIAESLPGCAFIDLERSVNEPDPSRRARIDQALTWLVEDGASPTAALVALVTALEAREPKAFVIDMVEQGLDHATQEALMAHLRRSTADAAPIFLLTRSNVILDLAAVGPDDAIILCPANHSPPSIVAPYPGAPGYEAVATCLASPEVRARMQGVVVMHPQVA